MPQLEENDPDINYDVGDSSCSYYEASLFRRQFSNNSDSLRVFHLNIRSVCKNMDELTLFLCSLKVEFHIIVLTETWLCDQSEFLDVAGYTAYHTVRTDRRGGGVTVLVKSNIQSHSLSLFSCITDHFEICSVRVIINKKKYNIIGVYRPPEKSVVDFSPAFFNLISHDEISNFFSVITGDFNININPTDLSDSAALFTSEFNSLHFYSKISVPTRVSNNSNSHIDHIWVNSPISSISGVFPIHISDHYPIFISLPNLLNSASIQLKKIRFRCHSEDNINSFVNRVGQFVGDFRIAGPNSVGGNCDQFLSSLYAIYDECCPVKQKTVSQKRARNPWLTGELLRCIARKHELYRLYRTDERYHELFKRYRNILTATIRDAKSNYYKREFSSNSNDIKKTWNSINKLMHPNGKRCEEQQTLSVNVNGNSVSDPASVAAAFNEHYTSVAHNLASQIPVTFNDSTTHVDRIPNSFVLFPMSGGEICKIIQSFKSKGSHLHTIPSFIFKQIAGLISPVLANLINISFAQGVFPDCLKIARVIPIFKSGEKDSILNYRPISTNNFISKVYERAMFNRLTNFLNKYNVINKEQFGFRKGCSTGDAIVKYTEAAYDAINDGDYLLAVLLDFSKAFDTVNHDILLKKLSLVGVRGVSLQWFRSYLSSRRQYVCIDDSCSSTLPIGIGVPQGSILGPLLFLIYINDMCRCSGDLKFVHFADDTTVFMRGRNLDNLHVEVNRQLCKVDSWLCANKLSLNIKKTSFMVHSFRSKITDHSISIRGIKIDRVVKAKFLGVIIDDCLKFKDQIKTVINKVSKSSGIMWKLSRVMPPGILIKLYYALIYPFLTYGIESWGSSGKTLLTRLSRRQKRCVKLLNKPTTGITLDIFRILKIFPLEDIFKYFVCVKFYKYVILKKELSFHNRVCSLQINHEFETRFKYRHLLRRPRINKSLCFNSFLYKSLTLWNTLPDHVKAQSSLLNFKQSLKNFLFNCDEI